MANSEVSTSYFQYPLLEQDVQLSLSDRRISKIDLQEAIAKCGPTANYFICGPSAMIDDVAKTLGDLGIAEEAIFFEKWS